MLASSTGPSNLQILAKFLQHEVAKPNLAPSSRYALLEWCAVALQHVSRHTDQYHHLGVELLLSLGRCFEKFLAGRPRENRAHSATVTTRRAIRSLFRSNLTRDEAVKDVVNALTSKGPSSKAEYAPLLGVVCGVAARLDAARAQVQRMVADIHAFYIRELLGSKVVLPRHISAGLHDFFSSFESSDAFQTEVIPALEKSMLRAPEVILNDLVTPLVQSLGSGTDWSEWIRTNLLKPLISNTKSTNAIIRDGAVNAYKIITRHSQKEEDLAAVSDELLKNLKDAKGIDQRIALAAMLASTSPAIASSSRITSGLTPLLPKESNETALSEEVAALGRQVQLRLRSEEVIDTSILKLFADGLRNKKPSVRRIWALAVGASLWPLLSEGQSDTVTTLASAIVHDLVASWEEALANPIPGAQSGLASASYVLFALALRGLHFKQSAKVSKALNKVNVVQQLQASEGKASLILNPRVYSKITHAEDLTWLLCILKESAGYLTHISHEARRAWSQALIYLLVASPVPAQCRQAAYQALANLQANLFHVVPATIIDGLWTWLKNVYSDERDTAAVSSQTGAASLWLVVRAICAHQQPIPSGDASVQQSYHLIRLASLCGPPLIPRITWIDTCLKAGRDPQELVSSQKRFCIQQLQELSSVR